MPSLEKSAALTIQEPTIDRDHTVFIDFVNQMQTADQQQFVQLFERLLTHTQAHFEYENKLMEQYGFPAIAEHQGEHHRVLTELKRFKQRVDKGMIAMGRAYISELVPQWFMLHVSTMDRALDAHIANICRIDRIKVPLN